jgi:heme-degrading monooxygenase HmoA
MSVTVTIRFPVADVAKAIKGLHSHAAILEAITESTKGAGILHHRFVAGDNEMMVIDEWESAKQWQTFFDANPQIAAVMTSIGMTGPPEVSIFSSIAAPGTL